MKFPSLFALVALLGLWLVRGADPVDSRSTLSLAAAKDPGPTQKTQEAYVTLLYNDDFLLGARVLGQSIRNSGSKK